MLERVMLSAGSGGSGWLARYGNGFDFRPAGINVDSSKNVYIGGWWRPDIWELVPEKLNSAGVVQWGRGLRAQVSDAYANHSTIDSSGNVYICGFQVYLVGQWFNPETGSWEDYYSYQLVVAKYNNSGTLQWKRYYAKPPTDPPDNGDERGNRVAVDGSGNVYVGGRFWGRPGLIKLNSSGTLQWQLRMDDGSDVIGLSVTSAGNVYAAVKFQDQRGFHVAKFNTSGTVQWQRQLSWGIGGSLFATDLAIDSSENVYAVGKSDSNGRPHIVKFNSSGTLQWQKDVQGVGGVAPRVSVDASGNSYIIGGTSSVARIVKFDTSGNTVWSREMTNLTPTFGAMITVDNLGSYYFIVYYAGSGLGAIVAKLPEDGGATGSYVVGGVSVDYLSFSPTVSNTSYTSSTVTNTWSNPSYNSGANSMGERTWTFATQVVEI